MDIQKDRDDLDLESLDAFDAFAKSLKQNQVAEFAGRHGRVGVIAVLDGVCDRCHQAKLVLVNTRPAPSVNTAPSKPFSTPSLQNRRRRNEQATYTD